MTIPTPAVAVYASVLSEDECRGLIALVAEWEHHKDADDERGAIIPYLPRVMHDVAPAIDRVDRLLQSHLLETVRLSIMRPGNSHPPHRDSQLLIAGAWLPNHTPHRTNAAMLYLNGDFEGGELCFHDLGVTVKPRPGLAVVFRSTVTHSVSTIRAGARYTVTAWGMGDGRASSSTS